MASLKRIGIGLQTGGLSELARLGMGGSPGGEVPNISAELARISALFEKARQSAVAGVNRQAQEGRVSAASNLASRGVYRSPVSQNTYDKIEAARLGGISDAEGQIAGQEAGMQSQFLQQLLGLNMAAKQRQAEARAARFGAAGGLGANLLLALLMRNPAMAASSVGGSAEPGSSLSPQLLRLLGGNPGSVSPGTGALRDY